MARSFRKPQAFLWMFVALIAIGQASGQQKTVSETDGDRQEQVQQQRHQAALDKVLPLCREIQMPNSQARPAGFNLNAHLREVERKRRAAGMPLWSNSGVLFMGNALAAEKDDARAVCLLQVLGDGGNPRAVAVLKTYASSPNATISEKAKQYLREMRRKQR